jgi:hypothetical protein
VAAAVEPDPPGAGVSLVRKSPSKPRRPTPQQTAALRKIASGWLDVTMRDGKPCCSYADGTTPSHGFNLARFISAGWLTPAAGCRPLFGDAFAQRYVARRP